MDGGFIFLTRSPNSRVSVGKWDLGLENLAMQLSGATDSGPSCY